MRPGKIASLKLIEQTQVYKITKECTQVFVCAYFVLKKKEKTLYRVVKENPGLSRATFLIFHDICFINSRTFPEIFKEL